MKKSKTGEALCVVTDALKKDPTYRGVWKANIAMCHTDSWIKYKRKTGKEVMNASDRHIIANNAAELFLQLLCDEIKFPKGR